VKQYVALALLLAVVESCVQPPLPPEPPITVVISQCHGWQDAGEPVVVQDPVPKPSDEVKAPPSELQEQAAITH
jgi:hypothetical protein